MKQPTIAPRGRARADEQEQEQEQAQMHTPGQTLSVGFLLRHPAHFIALGCGSGLAPWAPGTAGSALAWLIFVLLNPWLGARPWGWALVLALGLGVGVWACTLTAQHLGKADPGAIVWDEVLAFWLVMWLLAPAAGLGTLAIAQPAPWWLQALAFALFRFFDAAKPGPVGWADRRFKLQPGQAIGWRQGWGIVLDDLVAAVCTLLVLALLAYLAKPALALLIWS